MKLMRIPFNGVIIEVIEHDNRPVIPIAPLCAVLGLSAASQVSRCLKAALAIAYEIDGASYPAIPIEDLSWFLRTLRPRSSERQVFLRPFQADLTWAVLTLWFRDPAIHVSIDDYRRRMAQNCPLQKRNPPAPRQRICLDDVDEMRRLKDDGVSMAQIGRRFGVGRAAICQILNGKYPVSLRPRADIAAAPRVTAIKH